ncbi:hypothetical protein ACT6P2_08830 [Enterococcus lactis]|uniref:hypothetical protein n=1 Tax=Enterococcus lactis TaxID=357441 RepID=UPI0040419044
MTSKNENKELLTKKNQPTKTITQQDINALELTLEQLQSWSSILAVLNQFFDCEKEPINKKNIIHKYHSNAQVFKIFFYDFLQRTESLEKQLEKLKTREKVKIYEK